MRQIILEIAEALIKAILILSFLYFFFWPFQIDGTSMEDTFFDKDRISISRALAMANWVKHGDVVVCTIDDRIQSERIIKRVIGVPGDSVKIESGLVYLNGQLLDEYYISDRNTPGAVDVTLGEDEYFILGDNRNVSYDSRSIGPIKKSAIDGKVIMRWYPFNKIRFFASVKPQA